MRIVTPLPPFARGSVQAQNPGTQNNRRPDTPACRFCPPPSIPNQIITRDAPGTNEPVGDPIPGAGSGPVGDPNGVPGGIPNPDKGPVKPVEDGTKKNIQPRISIGHIEPALLTYRVEPLYPPLARQLRREGRVELRAIIATDGSIKSLEAISGDPLFFQSALDAVRQWRYRATILDGHSVEVDTHITVIYTFNH
jgi:protein TonB